MMSCNHLRETYPILYYHMIMIPLYHVINSIHLHFQKLLNEKDVNRCTHRQVELLNTSF